MLGQGSCIGTEKAKSRNMASRLSECVPVTTFPDPELHLGISLEPPRNRKAAMTSPTVEMKKMRFGVVGSLPRTSQCF